MTHLTRWKNAPKQRGTENVEPDLCRQEFRDDADINKMVERMMRGEAIQPRNLSFGYADYAQDLTTLQTAAQDFTEQYNSLPEDLRAKIDPQTYLRRALSLAALDPAQLRLELEEEAVAQPPQPQKDTEA